MLYLNDIPLQALRILVKQRTPIYSESQALLNLHSQPAPFHIQSHLNNNLINRPIIITARIPQLLIFLINRNPVKKSPTIFALVISNLCEQDISRNRIWCLHFRRRNLRAFDSSRFSTKTRVIDKVGHGRVAEEANVAGNQDPA